MAVSPVTATQRAARATSTVVCDPRAIHRAPAVGTEGESGMVFIADHRPDVIVKRVMRPVMVLIVTSLAVSICILGTVHLFAPVLTGA